VNGELWTENSRCYFMSNEAFADVKTGGVVDTILMMLLMVLSRLFVDVLPDLVTFDGLMFS